MWQHWPAISARLAAAEQLAEAVQRWLAIRKGEAMNGCWIVFDRNYRDEEAREIMRTIRGVRGVLDVVKATAGDGTNINILTAKLRLRAEIASNWYEGVQKLLGEGGCE